MVQKTVLSPCRKDAEGYGQGEGNDRCNQIEEKGVPDPLLNFFQHRPSVLEGVKSAGKKFFEPQEVLLINRLIEVVVLHHLLDHLGRNLRDPWSERSDFPGPG